MKTYKAALLLTRAGDFFPITSRFDSHLSDEQLMEYAINHMEGLLPRGSSIIIGYWGDDTHQVKPVY